MPKAVIIVCSLLIALFGSVALGNLASAQNQQGATKNHVYIETHQKKSAFNPLVVSSKKIYSNWTVNFLSTAPKSNYKIIKDGKTIAKGNFKGFHKTIKKTVDVGRIDTLKVVLNGEAFEYHGLGVMNKSVTKDDVEQVQQRKITQTWTEYLLNHLIDIALGGSLYGISLFVMFIFVKKRKKSQKVLSEGFD